jgi:hypothetical protein
MPPRIFPGFHARKRDGVSAGQGFDTAGTMICLMGRVTASRFFRRLLPLRVRLTRRRHQSRRIPQGPETHIVRAMTSTRAPQTPTAPAHATPGAPEWTIEDAKALYNVDGWGAGFIDINAPGHVVVRPDPNRPERTLDLHELAMDLEEQGVALPVLLRFSDILQTHRATE